MSAFIEAIRNKAKSEVKHIVLPESLDERMLKATDYIEKEKIAQITLVGNEKEIRSKAKEFRVDLRSANIVEPQSHPEYESFVDEYYNLRKAKGMTREKAQEVISKELFFSAMMVRRGLADGAVCGAVNSTGDVMLAAFHIIGKAPNSSVVSSCFAMIIPEYMGQKDHILFFGDCAIIPNPDASQLADIAIATADTRKALVGDEPKIAMLSFSTKGSAKHDLVDKVVKATNLVKERRPDLIADGEMQLDTAIVPKVGQSKDPNGPIQGEANVLIFPDLNAGNIGYKLVQRLANADAFGPISQGLSKPFNDLSRGCSMDDIINVVAATASKAQNQ